MELSVFKNQEFGSIRATNINGEPWFVGKDVAEVLGYSNPRDALSKHVDLDDKNTVAKRDGTTGNPNMTVINESGLYSLILGSKLPGAKKFKRWVTSEVLPSIRKNGGYIAGQETMSDDDLLAKALMVATKKIEERERLLEEQKPKVIFADAVSASENTILIGELAKILRANGCETGQNRLFETLRNDGFLINRKGTDYNMPTQKSMELGLMKIKENAITHSDGHVSITKTPKITGKGQQYFINRYCKA